MTAIHIGVWMLQQEVNYVIVPFTGRQPQGGNILFVSSVHINLSLQQLAGDVSIPSDCYTVQGGFCNTMYP